MFNAAVVIVDDDDVVVVVVVVVLVAPIAAVERSGSCLGAGCRRGSGNGTNGYTRGRRRVSTERSYPPSGLRGVAERCDRDVSDPRIGIVARKLQTDLIGAAQLLHPRRADLPLVWVCVFAKRYF